MSVTGRHEARERALALIYEAAQKHVDPVEVLDELTVAPDPYCALLVQLTSQHGAEARTAIETTAKNWPLDRIGLIDRLVMELAISELRGEDPPPPAVVLNEAVDLAKTYSTESSGSFVNGVLSAVLSAES
ncbi:MAG: transcription antitermination protein NusB [Actinomycetes bacterium]